MSSDLIVIVVLLAGGYDSILMFPWAQADPSRVEFLEKLAAELLDKPFSEIRSEVLGEPLLAKHTQQFVSKHYAVSWLPDCMVYSLVCLFCLRDP